MAKQQESAQKESTAEVAAILTTEPPAAPEPKRRGRPAGRKPRAKSEPEVLFLVESEPESGQYEMQEVPTTVELLDILDSQRRIIATRTWRTF